MRIPTRRVRRGYVARGRRKFQLANPAKNRTHFLNNDTTPSPAIMVFECLAVYNTILLHKLKFEIFYLLYIYIRVYETKLLGTILHDGVKIKTKFTLFLITFYY